MSEQPVVVVGAGPAGLAATIQLGRAGVDVLLVERRDAGSPLPRATVLSLRSMELLRSWGLEERVLAAAEDVAMTMLVMPDAARAAAGTTVDVGYPSATQSAVLSPTQAVCIAQDLLEQVLLEHLSTLARVAVVRGCEVVDVTIHSSTPRVSMRLPTGEMQQIEAQYVIGADGARSAVRRALGVELHGPEVLFDGMRVEFRAPLWDLLEEHRHLIYATTEPGATGVLLPAGQGDRWVFGITHGPEGDVSNQVTDAGLHERMLRATTLADDQVRVSRFDRFTSGAQIATRFSRGRVFLAGDAAHRVTPRGGTGLNIALADGHDLGWKLGWVLRGWVTASLLASYEAERRPAVQHNVLRSADPVGSRRSVTTEIQVDTGGRIKHAWISSGVSTLDLISDGLTLLAADPGACRDAQTGRTQGPPINAVAVDALTSRALGLGTRGAALVRPDGVPVATWSTTPSRECVRAAVSTLTAWPGSTRPEDTDYAA